MSSEASNKTITDMSFEEAIRELELVVRHLEEGRQPLEEAMSSYERGAALKERCEDLLKEARLKLEKIVQSSSGELAVETEEL